MNEKILEPKYSLEMDLEERLALAALVQYDGDESKIATKAADIIPEQLDTTKEEFEATLKSLVHDLSDVQLREEVVIGDGQ